MTSFNSDSTILIPGSSSRSVSVHNELKFYFVLSYEIFNFLCIVRGPTKLASLNNVHVVLSV